MARAASFATTSGSQANLCILAIVLFGTDSQKQTYLPKLVAGELVGAYALSESGSGSDALATKTRATRGSDGTWLLNGEKRWISVFANVDGEHFTAFIVEKRFPGVSSGKEEHKMSLHRSSSTSILLQDTRILADNVLGEIGKGHKIALNTLNFGRFKLGGMSVGGCRSVIGEAARYASQRN
jgi:alkylation response protein AidB-like acyl-CoA dehydrogenase